MIQLSWSFVICGHLVTAPLCVYDHIHSSMWPWELYNTVIMCEILVDDALPPPHICRDCNMAYEMWLIYTVTLSYRMSKFGVLCATDISCWLCETTPTSLYIQETARKWWSFDIPFHANPIEIIFECGLCLTQ